MRSLALILLISAVSAGNLYGGDEKHAVAEEANKCIGAGPQSPRDIDSKAGSNAIIFEEAPSITKMNLCDIHFHRNAEHKSEAYSKFVEDGSNSGWACQEPSAGRLSGKHVEHNGCGGIAEGDTIEVHWVHTSCDIVTEGVKTLGEGLNACLTTSCSNPQLRVVAQVFVLQKNGEFKFAGTPIRHNDPTVVYAGSSTGANWNNNHCSPLQVTWDVKKTCDMLDIDDFSDWCSNNKYKETHAHRVRELVTSEALLSKISH